MEWRSLWLLRGSFTLASVRRAVVTCAVRDDYYCVWEGFMRRALNAMVVRKQTGKIVLLPSAEAGNGTVTVANLKNKDTEYYQVGLNGDYVQEGH